MGKVLINDSTLTSIGDAIREKTGSTDTYKPSEMPQAISSIIVSEEELLDRLLQGLSEKDLTNEEVAMVMQILVENPKPYRVPNLGSHLFRNQSRILSEINIPEGIEVVGLHCFETCMGVHKITLPSTLKQIYDYAFAGTSFGIIRFPAALWKIGDSILSGSSTSFVYFKSKPTDLSPNAFYGAPITDIYVPWSEGEVAYAPWGAKNATIHYNYTEEV